MFLTTDLEHLSSIQSIWANPIEDATTDKALN
jgi:hypothetical protein